MTQTGKCDTCRQRKVKCDEEKPKCGACQKKDRPCTYTYGKASALVIQDPNQLTKHGKARIAPVVHTLSDEAGHLASSSSSVSTFQITTEREAETGKGMFQTLTPISKAKAKQSRKAVSVQRKRLEMYLEHLRNESRAIGYRPSSPEATLAARYIDLIGLAPVGQTPISVLGTWVESIPARIGTNRILDLAVKYLVDSWAVFWDDTHSKRKVAVATKSKALKELQLLVHGSEGAQYDTILAMKLHYASEVLMGIDTMYHTIHAFGLAEILKTGAVTGIDENHYWDFLDNTYIDDVSEAMLAGRTSVYDNELYLALTFPPTLGSKRLPPHQKASMAMMHSMIQLPRLVCLIRHVIAAPQDSATLASAVALAETLWELDPCDYVKTIIQDSLTTVPSDHYPEVADWLPNIIEYDTIQSMVTCSRYWMLQIQLCGLIDTLHRHFPNEVAASLLPGIEMVQKIEINAAIQVAQSLHWSLNVSRTFPLVPLRLHTPLQVSAGPWHRLIRHLSSNNNTSDTSSNSTSSPGFEFGSSKEVSDATRMILWVVEQCNRVHDAWKVSRVKIEDLMAAVDAVAGERIPEWMPVKVRFENEDGEMVMKLDYEVPTPIQRSFQNPDHESETWSRKTVSASPFGPQDRTRWDQSFMQDLPFRPATDRRSGEVKTITFNNTNKNPCFAPSWTLENPKEEVEGSEPLEAWGWWTARYRGKFDDESPSSSHS